MLRMMVLIGCPLLLAFAPVPLVRPLDDPDRAIRQFDRNASALQSRGEKTFAERKQQLVDRLNDHQSALLDRGRIDDADLVRDSIILVDSIDGMRPLGAPKALPLLRKASMNGKYGHLLRTVYVPGDRLNYDAFMDFGYWNGGYYAGETSLQAGHWVYVHPRWFVWRDGPTTARLEDSSR